MTAYSVDSREARLLGFASAATALVSSFALGLAASRILYEALFPRWLTLSRPAPAVLLAAVFAALGGLLWFWLSQSRDMFTATIPFVPLLFNALYLTEPSVNLVTSRFIFFATLWLMVLFLARIMARPAVWRWLGFVLLLAFLLPVYLLTMGRTVGSADTFEFQVVAPNLGIVHPTGYPLYLLLSKLFTLIPLNSIAWRVNLATALFGLAATCLLYLLIWRLTGRSLPAILAALLFGLTPTFWSQAVEAEVYTLHALIVAAALLLMREIGSWELTSGQLLPQPASPGIDSHSETGAGSRLSAYSCTIILAFVLGLGLTNHLTSIILLAPAALTIIFAYRDGRFKQPVISKARFLVAVTAAFLLPLLIYAYLPIRWAAVNGEPMGFARFVDWVIGGRFQGALQLTAWLNDPARYQIVGRLIQSEWQLALTVLLALIGAIWLVLRQWRYGLILLITWLGFMIYGLNYYVPDLAVFLIPAHLITAAWWAAGVIVILIIVSRIRGPRKALPLLLAITLLLAVMPALLVTAEQTWPNTDQSQDDGRTQWAQAVLDLPLEPDSTILADSDKFPPLYYLQQAEGLRPDLNIMVLPDESAYRAELDAHLVKGRNVYLARFLPGLEGIYYLRSLGPLTQVSSQPVSVLPAEAVSIDLSFGSIQLLGYTADPNSPFSDGESVITLYWRANESLTEILHVYTRWAADDYEGQPIPIAGQHPAGNDYPTVAWRPDEVIADYHELPWPDLDQKRSFELQVALAPPFTAAETLEWQTVTSLAIDPAAPMAELRPIRAQFGDTLLNGITFPVQIRPQGELAVVATGHGGNPEQLEFVLLPAGTKPQAIGTAVALDVGSDQSLAEFVFSAQLNTNLPHGRYMLWATHSDAPARCGWLFRQGSGCTLGEVEISGVPMPDGATNFEDKIALISAEVQDTVLRPGGQLPVDLTWQALAPVNEDYTVFVQVLDAEDKIVGQVDSWPLQGTYPTSQWQPGEIINDPYLVQLDAELAPGSYRLHVGWYLLSTLRRLPVLDDSGRGLDDKIVVPGLVVPAD